MGRRTLTLVFLAASMLALSPPQRLPMAFPARCRIFPSPRAYVQELRNLLRSKQHESGLCRGESRSLLADPPQNFISRAPTTPPATQATVHTAVVEIKNATITRIILDLSLSKTQTAEHHDNRNVIVFKKFCFKLFSVQARCLQIPSV